MSTTDKKKRGAIPRYIVSGLAINRSLPYVARVLLFVYRMTFGFNRLEAKMTMGFISNGTGIDRANVNRTLKRLIQANLISRKGSIVRVNGRVRTWNDIEQNVKSFDEGLKSKQTTGVESKQTTDVESILHQGVVYPDSQEYLKEENKKKRGTSFLSSDQEKVFQEVYDLYPLKGKDAPEEKAREAFSKIPAAHHRHLIEAVKEYRMHNDGKFNPVPIHSFLGNDFWKDWYKKNVPDAWRKMFW